MFKTCYVCRIEKSIEDFYRDKSQKDGRRKDCKACKAIKVEQWRANNRTRYNAKAKEYNKKHYERLRLQRYHLTLEQYQQKLIDQKGLCKICEKKTNDKKLVVDHCHKTGKPRDLLCRKCNTLMSLVDNPELLAKMLSYAASHK